VKQVDQRVVGTDAAIPTKFRARGGTGALLVLIVAAPVALAGCPAQRVRMYRGEELRENQVASVTGEFNRGGIMISLENIDGARVPGQGPIRGGIYSRKTEAVIAPGVHTVEVTFWGPDVQSLEPTPVTFDAEAGHQYEIRVARAPGQEDTFWSRLAYATIGRREPWLVWVVDLQTGQPVPPAPTGNAPKQQQHQHEPHKTLERTGHDAARHSRASCDGHSV